MKKIYFIIIFAFVLLFQSCSSEDSSDNYYEKMAGVWKCTDVTEFEETIEGKIVFSNDGAIQLKKNNYNSRGELFYAFELEGRYVLNGTSLKINYDVRRNYNGKEWKELYNGSTLHYLEMAGDKTFILDHDYTYYKQ